jgi:glycine/D-amino acid oxidase-like deaminating enzyme
MGHIVAMDDSDALFALIHYSQQLWHKLAEKLPAAAYRTIGTQWVAEDAEELSAAEAKHAYFIERGLPCRMLTRAELLREEPHLASDLAGGLLVTSDSVVDSPTVARFLAETAQSAGAYTIVGQRVEAIGEGILRLSNGLEIRASHVLNTLGADALRMDSHLPIRPRKGHLAISSNYPDLVHHQVVELGYIKSAHNLTADSVAFNVQPRADGQLCIGSSRQFHAPTDAVEPEIITAMLARAKRFLPDIDIGSPMQTRAGFRAATPDKLPLIGPDPADGTILLATGHEGLGITTALATAELIADYVTGRKHAIDPTPYLPARFPQLSQ